MKLDHFLTPYTKINSKWIKDLNVSPKSIKLIKENIGNMLSETGLSNIFFFLDLSPQARAAKAKVNKWHYIKLKSFAQQKKPSTKQKGNLLNERRYLQMIHLIMD